MKHENDALEDKIAIAICKRNSLSENNVGNQLLENMMWSAGYGYHKVVGHVANNENKQAEESFFIIDGWYGPDRLQKYTIAWSKYFEKYTISFKIFNRDTFLPTNNENIKEFKTELSVERISQMYSEILDTPYVAESAEYVDLHRGMGGAMARAKYDKLIEGPYEEFVAYFDEHAERNGLSKG